MDEGREVQEWKAAGLKSGLMAQGVAEAAWNAHLNVLSHPIIDLFGMDGVVGMQVFPHGLVGEQECITSQASVGGLLMQRWIPKEVST